MAFSQSMSFGETTFNLLENQVSSVNTTPLNNSKKSCHDESDVVEESPTSTSNHNVYSKSIKERLRNISTQGRKRKKSVSRRRSQTSNKKLTYLDQSALKDLTDCFATNFTEDNTKLQLLNECVVEDMEDDAFNDVDFDDSFTIPACDSKRFRNNSLHVHSALLIETSCWDDTSLFNDIQTEDVGTLLAQTPEQHVFSQSYVLDCDFSACDSILTAEVEEKMREQKSLVQSALAIEEESQMNSNYILNLTNTTIEKSARQQKSFHEPPREDAIILSQKLVQPKKIAIATRLANWNIPAIVLNEYKKKGVDDMFEWQAECLSNSKVLLDGANFVYSAPTSAGKTLVSEILMIKNVLERHKKAIFILPFISVVREKITYLQDLLTPAGVLVDGFYGSYSPHSFEALHIAVCTIEKSNSIINKLLENNKLEDIGMIVIDEAHLVGDPGRGYILELLLAKVLYVCRKRNYCIQIVAMSATLPNLDLLSKWLNAEFYATTFRPVQLNEMIKIGDTIYDSKMKRIRKINDRSALLPKDQDDVAQLCLETLVNGHSVLVFCPSKDWCETLCKHIAGYFYAAGKSETLLSEKVRSMINIEQLEEVKSQLLNCTSGLDDTLSLTVSYACAFHHAGLTMEERDIIEGSFKSGALKVIVATSTLSSGVNLPARRVIVRTPMFGGRPIESLTYKQMIGRAGRKGKDTLGESILICSNLTEKAGKDLIAADLNPITSSLGCNSNINFKRAILEIIASEMASSMSDLEMFIDCTLFCTEQRELKLSDEADPRVDPISDCIKFLVDYEFIALQQDELTGETYYVPTKLGSACLSSSMPPSDGFLLFTELQKSRQCFVLESELHAIYLVTPFSVCHQMQNINWMHFLDLWDKLPASMRRVGDLVGVRESFLIKAMRGTLKLENKALQVHKRFYTALALQELVNEAPITSTALKYNCSRGLLQGLQQMASTFAGIVTAFCNALNWTMLALIVSQFKDRLYFGIHRDLLNLMKIPNLNAQRARALFDKGITNLPELANADVLSVERILTRAVSFDLQKQRDDENVYDAQRRANHRNLFVTGKLGLTVKEAARLFIEDARKFLENEMGIQNVKWSVKQINESQKEVDNDILQQTMPIEKSSIIDESQNADHRKTRLSLRMEESLLENSMIIQNDLESVQIVDVCGSQMLFNAFKSTLATIKEAGFAICLNKMSMSQRAIGANLLKTEAMDTETYNFVVNENSFIDGVTFSFNDNISYYIRLQQSEILLNERVQLLEKALARKDLTFIAFNAREQFKILMKTIPSLKKTSVIIRDPKIAHWIIHQDDEPDINALVNEYATNHSSAFNLVGRKRILSKIGMDTSSTIEPELRGGVECILAKEIFKTITRQLDESSLKSFEDVEMPIQAILLKMEIKGFPIIHSELSEFSKKLNQQLKIIEDKVVGIVGRRVNFGSTKEIAKILGVLKTDGAKRSTKKDVLQKIDSPLSNLIIEHRKLTAILNNNVMPLIAVVQNNRIYGSSCTFTSTGRITMLEPNVQNVAKDFETNSIAFSFRSCFRAPDHFKIVSADFCQLELRILTHLSKDPLLLKIMKSDRDVFKGIASRWNNIPEAKIDETMRNNTKQICYGIIYGIGAKSLASNLNCDMTEATTLMEQFHATYPRLRYFTDKVIKSARSEGYVETLMARRRYITEISSSHSATRSAAERKAVNSVIQGTAADILKEAMIRMEINLKKQNIRNCNLILHLHDELLYEVHESAAEKVATILKQSMENCLQLSIPLPVKVKIGSSWGQLKEL